MTRQISPIRSDSACLSPEWVVFGHGHSPTAAGGPERDRAPRRRRALGTEPPLGRLDPSRSAGGGRRSLTRGRHVPERHRQDPNRRDPSCGGSVEVKTLSGPTALGLLPRAARKQLSPCWRRSAPATSSEFGLFLCGLGDFVGTDTAFWLYKVDHVAPDVGGDQFPKKGGGEEVLWYFSDTDHGHRRRARAGSAGRARPGEAWSSTVWAYIDKGERTPAAGARLQGVVFSPVDRTALAGVSS